MAWPVRGQQSPDFWDVDLKDYIDDGDLASAAPKANIDSPVFTGDPKAPTPATTDNDTSIATTAFVKAAIALLVDSSPATLDTLNELAAALGDDPNFATTMTNALATKAPLASPALTGNPTAPTPSTLDNDTSVATTAFVKAQPGTITTHNIASDLSGDAAANTFVTPITGATGRRLKITMHLMLKTTTANGGVQATLSRSTGGTVTQNYRVIGNNNAGAYSSHVLVWYDSPPVDAFSYRIQWDAIGFTGNTIVAGTMLYVEDIGKAL